MDALVQPPDGGNTVDILSEANNEFCSLPCGITLFIFEKGIICELFTRCFRCFHGNNLLQVVVDWGVLGGLDGMRLSVVYSKLLFYNKKTTIDNRQPRSETFYTIYIYTHIYVCYMYMYMCVLFPYIYLPI